MAPVVRIVTGNTSITIDLPFAEAMRIETEEHATELSAARRYMRMTLASCPDPLMLTSMADGRGHVTASECFRTDGRDLARDLADFVSRCRGDVLVVAASRAVTGSGVDLRRLLGGICSSAKLELQFETLRETDWVTRFG